MVSGIPSLLSTLLATYSYLRFQFNLDVAINTVTTIFRTYLAEQSIDHLSSALKKGGIKDLVGFFPPNKRNAKTLDAHFREAGLPQVADWYAKRQALIAKDVMLKELKERLENEDSNESVSLSNLTMASACVTYQRYL